MTDKISDRENIIKELSDCCGSEKWVSGMYEHYPFKTEEKLFYVAERIWFSLNESDWLEAFLHHPKIGDINSLREKFSSSKHLAENEQAGVNDASPETLHELARFNEEYEKKFGYIFIVCATGKSAEEMLDIIRSRIGNEKENEILTAMKEQSKITQIRLNKIKDKLL